MRPDRPSWQAVFGTIEDVCVILFSIDYLIRLLTCSSGVEGGMRGGAKSVLEFVFVSCPPEPISDRALPGASSAATLAPCGPPPPATPVPAPIRGAPRVSRK